MENIKMQNFQKQAHLTMQTLMHILQEHPFPVFTTSILDFLDRVIQCAAEEAGDRELSYKLSTEYSYNGKRHKDADFCRSVWLYITGQEQAAFSLMAVYYAKHESGSRKKDGSKFATQYKLQCVSCHTDDIAELPGTLVPNILKAACSEYFLNICPDTDGQGTCQENKDQTDPDYIQSLVKRDTPQQIVIERIRDGSRTFNRGDYVTCVCPSCGTVLGHTFYYPSTKRNDHAYKKRFCVSCGQHLLYELDFAP